MKKSVEKRLNMWRGYSSSEKRLWKKDERKVYVTEASNNTAIDIELYTKHGLNTRHETYTNLTQRDYFVACLLGIVKN